MNKWLWIRLIAALFALCVCMSPALAEEESQWNDEPEFEEVTVYEGTPAVDAAVNIRQKPDAQSKKVAAMAPGEKCTVTGKSNGWYSVAFNGVMGYVRQDLLTLSKHTELVEKVVEAPLEAQCEEFGVSYMQAPGTTFRVSGKVTSNIPITEVRLTVYDLRQLRDEASVSAKFTREQNVTEFDLSSFSNQSPLLSLCSGEKKVRVEVSSANDQALLGERRSYVSGKCSDPVSMTDECTVVVSRGSKSAMLDCSYATSWSISSSNDTLKVRFPDGKTAGGILLEWEKAPEHVQIELYDENGEVMRTIQEKNPYGKWNLFYALEEGVAGFTLRSGDKGNGINKLRIYEQGKIPEMVQRWEDTPEHIDMMLIVPHMNDETLYFSGVLSQLSAQGKNVLVVYMTGDDRNKHAEALDCLWTAGVKIHPVFVGFMDYKVDSYAKAEWLWGSENTYRAIIGLLRQYKPDVVLTQDWNGEYGHNQHIMTSRYTVKSVEAAGNADIFSDIAEEYGVWDVPKLYLHMWDESKRLDLHFNTPMDALDGLTPMQMAFIQFDKHQSQIKRYSLKGDGVTYDCTWFSLYRSLVGEDVARDSFFENLE